MELGRKYADPPQSGCGNTFHFGPADQPTPFLGYLQCFLLAARLELKVRGAVKCSLPTP